MESNGEGGAPSHTAEPGEVLVPLGKGPHHEPAQIENNGRGYQLSLVTCCGPFGKRGPSMKVQHWTNHGSPPPSQLSLVRCWGHPWQRRPTMRLHNMDNNGDAPPHQLSLVRCWGPLGRGTTMRLDNGKQWGGGSTLPHS